MFPLLYSLNIITVNTEICPALSRTIYSVLFRIFPFPSLSFDPFPVIPVIHQFSTLKYHDYLTGFYWLGHHTQIRIVSQGNGAYLTLIEILSPLLIKIALKFSTDFFIYHNAV